MSYLVRMLSRPLTELIINRPPLNASKVSAFSASSRAGIMFAYTATRNFIREVCEAAHVADTNGSLGHVATSAPSKPPSSMVFASSI